MNHFLLLFALLGCAIALPHLPRRQRTPRIINGQDATPGQFPYIVALNVVNGYTWCSGLIIDTQWILTTADCVQIMYDDDYVVAGSIISNATETIYHISQVIAHEEFDFFTFENDIALIQIDGELTYDDHIQPIEIGEVSDNSTCTIMGWGVSTDQGQYPYVLQYAEESTIDMETCQDLVNSDAYYLGEKIVCGLGVDEAFLCWGDSGGPLICDGAVAGLATYSLPNCLATIPDLFTRVALYKDWINSKISGARK